MEKIAIVGIGGSPKRLADIAIVKRGISNLRIVISYIKAKQIIAHTVYIINPRKPSPDIIAVIYRLQWRPRCRRQPWCAGC